MTNPLCVGSPDHAPILGFPDHLSTLVSSKRDQCVQLFKRQIWQSVKVTSVAVNSSRPLSEWALVWTVFEGEAEDFFEDCHPSVTFCEK